MIITTSINEISPKMLAGGFFAGWPNPPSPEKHYDILKNSYKVVIDDKENKVIGFINAISDGVLSAYIPLLEVLKEHQNKGIGLILVKQMLNELSNIYMIDLISDENLRSYYEKVGMSKANGMIYRNYKYQSGR